MPVSEGVENPGLRFTRATPAKRSTEPRLPALVTGKAPNPRSLLDPLGMLALTPAPTQVL